MDKIVNPIVIALLLVGVVSFLGLGGVDKASKFIKGFGKDGSQQTTVDTEVAGGSASQKITQQKASATELNSIVARRGKSRDATFLEVSAKPSRSGTSTKVLSPQSSGAIAGRSNISGGRSVTLSVGEIAALRAKPLTAVEQRDVAALTARFGRKSKTQQRVKTDPLQLVLQKREQDLISRKVIGEDKFVGGKLFAKEGFATGGLTKSEAQRRASVQAEVKANLAANAKRKQEEIAAGKRIQLEVGTTAQSQKEAAASKGVAIRGGNVLSPRALAKLREKGLI